MPLEWVRSACTNTLGEHPPAITHHHPCSFDALTRQVAGSIALLVDCTV